MSLEATELSDNNIIEVDSFYLNSKGIQGPFIAMNVKADRIHFNKADLIKLNKLFQIRPEDLAAIK